MTLIAGLRLTGMTAPWVLDGPMDGDTIQVYVRNVPAPTFRRGDVVVLDNLPAHKVPGIREAITARRAQLFYLPPYSRYMNPIEMAFAKRKGCCGKGPRLPTTLSILLLLLRHSSATRPEMPDVLPRHSICKYYVNGQAPISIFNAVS